MATKRVDPALTRQVGAHVLAMQLAGIRDPGSVDDTHLGTLADLAVRAALAIEAAIPRMEQLLADQAEAAKGNEDEAEGSGAA